MSRRVPLNARWRGPETKQAFKNKTRTIAKLSQECGWQKPLIKLPKEGKQS